MTGCEFAKLLAGKADHVPSPVRSATATATAQRAR